MELKTSTDPKIVKMFRRLEKFLDQEGLATLGRSVDFMNAETGRVFAVFLSPDSRRELTKERDALLDQLTAANVTLEILEDDNALLALIDAQNNVLMGRATTGDEVSEFDPYAAMGEILGGDDFDLPPDEDPDMTVVLKRSEWEIVVAPFYEPVKASPLNKVRAQLGGLRAGWSFAPVKIAEDSPGVFITEQEYEELINLRVKRARDKETITGLNATVKENKKGAETLQRQRDSYLAQLLEEKARFENLVNDLFYGNKITLNEARIFNGDVAIPGGDAYYNDATRDHAPRHAFTSDAIRDSDFFGYKPEDFR